MPKGKGTYGSKVGRPPKKKYDKGGKLRRAMSSLGKVSFGGGSALDTIRDRMASEEVDPFSTRNPEGVPAEKVAEATEQQNQEAENFDAFMTTPTSNAMERSQTMPDTEKYNKGGKVREWQKNPKDTKFKAKFPKQTFKGKEVKPVPLPKDVSKQYFKGKETKPAKGFYAKSGKKGKKK